MNFSQYKSKFPFFILVLLVVVLAALILIKRESLKTLFLQPSGLQEIKLPAPVYHSNISIEETLKQRRSIRRFKNEALNLAQAAQLLWAAQGITSPSGFRTAPSAGGIYPLELYLVNGNVQDLPQGIYHYSPLEHSLNLLMGGDKRAELAAAAHEQNDLKEGAMILVITANYKKTNHKYGTLGERFVNMEVGHAAENIYLQSVSLGVGTVSIGVFDENAVKRILGLPREEEPLYLMPVGKIEVSKLLVR